MNIQTITSDQYPYLLKQISQLPKYLDVIGTIPSDENRFLCVIGARKHTSYGKEVCERLIAGLAGYPIVIVSGLALGIDSVAHAAALKAGLKTIAFPGSGLNEQVIYPEEHKPLAKQIVAAGGALVSPFARDQIGVYWSFPTRNRLMAGISHAVLIIEASMLSNMIANNFFDFIFFIALAASNASFSFLTSISMYLIFLFLFANFNAFSILLPNNFK